MSYYVYEANLQAGDVTELAYIVTGAECADMVGLMGTYGTADAAGQASMAMASAAAAEGNRGARIADGIVDDDELRRARREYQSVVEVYLSGAGMEVDDSSVADVLGVDMDDLMDGLDRAEVGVADVLSNTGRYVTRDQYLRHLADRYRMYRDDGESICDWALRHGAGSGLVAELESWVK